MKMLMIYEILGPGLATLRHGLLLFAGGGFRNRLPSTVRAHCKRTDGKGNHRRTASIATSESSSRLFQLFLCHV